ncbi:Imm58 family immunity protein [Methylobacter sp.]|uniref:Imm58 family immunity protein n=1 Tax=Methylobacter sp. TaxID=2051955 RepID=UPI002FDD8EDA
MQVSMRIFWVICVLLTGIILWLIFIIIDQSVTLDYQNQHASRIVEQRNLLVQVVNSTCIGTPESKVRDLINSLVKDSSFEKGKNEIVAGQIMFFFKEGRFIRIEADSE